MSGGGRNQGPLRIRMYRVGFGDFFLLTVPTDDGPEHILIDCGVTPGRTKKGDIGTLKDAVKHMADETKGKLALIIATHRHQDHIIGFSRAADVFQKFRSNVGAVWMSVWETEYDPNERKGKKKGRQERMAFKGQQELTSLALGMQRHVALAGAASADAGEIAALLQNATGVDPVELAAAEGHGAGAGAGKGGGTNQASLAFLKTGLGVKPQYYAKGDQPALPASLARAGLKATILGPPPIDEIEFMKLMDLKKGLGQYLDNADGGLPDSKFLPFEEKFHADAAAYPDAAFREWQRGAKDPAKAMEQAVQASQPGLLLTAARTLDNVLNNQSLVVLFNYKEKRLLFAGDAQGGNWEYWMFGGTPTKAPSIDRLEKDSKGILEHLDFYKMGHHGSTNATPVSAVETMGGDFATMCSTQEDSFGSVANESEVPRLPLLEALGRKSRIIRSDQVQVNYNGTKVPAVKGSPKTLPKPLHGKVEVGPIYVDYFP